jgi:hypothetical protein
MAHASQTGKQTPKYKIPPSRRFIPLPKPALPAHGFSLVATRNELKATGIWEPTLMTKRHHWRASALMVES